MQADLARFKAYVEMKDAKGIEYRSGSDEQQEQRGSSNRSGDREQTRAERAKARLERRSGAEARS